MNQHKDCHPCSCKCADDCCGPPVLCRPKYFPRQLITPEELTLEADYFRDMFRRLRRLLWGWGVVCGAVVCRAPKCPEPGDPTPPPCDPWKVLVKPGYILGPCGDEIIIPCDTVVDLRRPHTTGTGGEACPEPCDPWCEEPAHERKPSTFCVAIKYRQVMTRPVRVQPAGCGCDDSACEYSRWCDGFEIRALSECPECDATPPSLEEELRHFLPRKISDCPECPTTPWVCLARVKVDESGILDIENCPCRRLVPTLRGFWSKCAEEPCRRVEEKPARTEPEKAPEGTPPPTPARVPAPRRPRRRRR